MKRKVKTRLLSALLALAMLACLLPTALAASNYDEVEKEMDSDDSLSLSFIDSYSPFSDYYIEDIRGDKGNDNYEPVVVDKYGDDNWRYIDADELSSYYFESYSKSYGTYEYTIDIVSEDFKTDGDEFTLYLTLYVDERSGSSSSSSKGDIYADTDSKGYLDLDGIADELYDFGYDGMSKDTPYSVSFTSCSNGSVYYDSDDDSAMNDEIRFDSENYLRYAVYFEAKDTSKESKIYFTVYGDGSQKVSGTIIVNGDGSSSSSSAGDIKYSTGYNTSVTFKGSDFENLLGSKEELNYVTFSQPSSSKGTLYTTSSEKTSVSSKDEFDLDDLDEVTFSPKSGTTGNVSISFTLNYYNSNDKKATKKGTVVISIADGKTITYSCEAKGEVTLDSDDFDDICYEVTKKDLDYVKFSLPSSSKGTLYASYDGSSKGSTAAKSSDKFYVSPGRSDYGLDDVVFVPNTTGTIEFSYTAYPVSGNSFTGKVQIDVTAGTLTPINYTVTGGNTKGVTFSSNDFVTALKSQTSNSLSSVTFTLPNNVEGTLYYEGSSKVSSSTQYKANSTTNSLDKVSFIPGTGITGNITINYTAKDSRNSTYKGTIVVKTFVGEDTVLTYTTTGRPANFNNMDFQNACMKKLGTTLKYVKFDLPSSSQGTLYYGYGSTQQTRVSSSAKYQTTTHLDFISFMPNAGFSGTATISYTGFDMNENFYYGTITVTVTPPTRSSYFVDASESWIAPAADFLYNGGVYTGVVAGNTLGVRDKTTRGEVMQMIYNAFNLKSQVASVESHFTDVPATHAYYTAINAANQLGIALGDQGKFRPNEAITRQDAMTLLFRAFTKLGITMVGGGAGDLQSFRDFKDVDSYAVEALGTMARSGIIQGDAGMIKPKGDVSRGEVSVMLYRAMTL